MAFWSALTGREARQAEEPEFVILQRPFGDPVRILLQRRDDGEPSHAVTAHLDIAAGSDVDRLAAQHVEAGARLGQVREGWTTLTDPARRPYCLTGRHP